MTEIERSQLALELLNAFVPLLVGAFLLGLIVGVFFFGRLASTIDRLGERLRRPKRVKFVTGKDFEYLYLFRGRYYKLSAYQQAMEDNGYSLMTYKAYRNYLKQQKQVQKQ